jgi:hypothetical protein
MNFHFIKRIIRACKLDVNLYEEVEADKSAKFQAAAVVVTAFLVQSIILVMMLRIF